MRENGSTYATVDRCSPLEGELTPHQALSPSALPTVATNAAPTSQFTGVAYAGKLAQAPDSNGSQP